MVICLITTIGCNNDKDDPNPESTSEGPHIIYADPFRDNIYKRYLSMPEKETEIVTPTKWNDLGGDVADFDYDMVSNTLFISQLPSKRILVTKNGEVEALYSNEDSGSARGIVADHITGDIYWVNSDTKNIMKGNINGAPPTAILSGKVEHSYDLYLHKYVEDEQFLYYSEFSNDPETQGLWELRLKDGAVPTRIIPGKIRSFAIDFETYKVYYAIDKDIYLGILAPDNDGTKIFTGEDNVYGITLDNENKLLYWSERHEQGDATGSVVAYASIDPHIAGERTVLINNLFTYSLFLQK